MTTLDSGSWERGVADAARALLDGRAGVIETARAIVRLPWDDGPAGDDADLAAFFVIDSDSDHLPIGKERENWGTEALERQDSEIREVEEFHRDSAMTAAARLVEKYGHS